MPLLNWLKWQLIRFDYWMLRRAYLKRAVPIPKVGDRYQWRDDETCLSDECVAHIREAEGR